uniref:hypothetical protein n=1 Tax=Amycolatopsis sp. CA-096443 TaxID=3239919 RepID=UPI003F4939F8
MNQAKPEVLAVAEPGEVTFDGARAACRRVSERRWAVTVDGRPAATLVPGALPGRWRAVNPGGARCAVEDGPQAALDALAAAIRREQRQQAGRARMSPAQREAQDLCTLLGIGPRTRRWRAADSRSAADTHQVLLTAIEALVDGDEHCELAGACLTYREHIETGGDLVCHHVRGLKPWRLAGLLADMADGGVADAAAGARWLAEVLRPRLGRAQG